MAGRPIVVSIIGDNKKLAGAVDSSNSKLGTLGKVAKGAGVAVGAGLVVAGAAAIKLGQVTVKSASLAQQSLGATETVFGKYADTVIKRSNQAARSVGLSANEYRELANVVGASLKGAGVETGKAAKLTDDLNKRAADLAATFGGTTSEAVQAFSSLLRGEADPIERYGISVKQSDVNARLAALGLDKLTGSALKQAEMQARLDLAFKQSADSQGAFRKEGNTLAGVQQRMGAQVENISAKLGGFLLPVLTKVGGVVAKDVLPQLDNLVDRFGPKLGASLEAAAGKIGPLIEKLPKLFQGGGDAGPTITALQSIADSAGQLAPAITGAASSLPSFLDLLNVSATVLAFVADHTDTLVKLLPLLVIGYAGVKAAQLAANVAAVLTIPVKITEVVVNRQLVASNRALIASRAGDTAAIVTNTGAEKIGLLTRARGVVGMVAHRAALIASATASKVAAAGQWLLNAAMTANPIGLVVAGLALLVGGLILAYKKSETFREIVNGAFQKVQDAGQALVSFVTEKIPAGFNKVVSKIKGAFSGLPGEMATIGVNLIGGLLSGIRSMAGQLVSTITSYVIDKIPGPVRKALGISSPSKVFHTIGTQIVAGLVEGVKGGGPALNEAVKGMGDLIAKAWEKTGHDKPLKAGRIASIIDSVDKEVRKLRDKARDYAKLAQTIQDARDLAAGVKAAAIAGAAVTGVAAIDVLDAEGNVTGQTQTAQNLVSGLQVKLDALKAFAANVDALRKAGLSQASVDQIIQEGVEKGSLTAAALVAGGPQAIAAVNSLQEQITGAAGTLGQVAAVNMYGTGQQAAEGFVAGLEASLDKLDRAAKRIARQLVKAIKKELGIKSPSTVARQLAKSFTDGIVVQTYADSRRAQLAGRTTAAALVEGFGRPQVSADALLAGAQGRAGVMQLELSAEQLDQLQRGAQLRADLDAWSGIGGRVIAQ